MKKVIFGGEYGIRSYGDDGPLIVMTDMLRERIDGLESVAIARNAEEKPYAEHGIRSINGLMYPTKQESSGKWFRGFNFSDDKTELCQLYKEIAGSDLLLLGAGNFLVDYTIDILKGPVPKFVVLSTMAKMTGTPVMWFGISVGPLKTKLGRDMSRLAALDATKITVRDEKSITELLDIGVNKETTLLPDANYRLPVPGKGFAGKFTPWVEAHQDNKPVIAVSVRSLTAISSSYYEKYLTLTARTCDLIGEEMKANVLFIPQCTYRYGEPEQDDRFVAREVTKRMSGKEHVFTIEQEIGLYDCLALYEKASAALCTRLHGSVYAIMQGVPAIGINYNPKVYQFFYWLGYEDLVVELADLDPEVIVSKLNKAISSRDEIIKRSSKRLLEGRKEVEKYADLAIEAMKYKIHYG